MYGDPHLGHEYIAKLRGFKTIEEHNEFIINMWNFVVTKRDKVFLMGDVTGGSAKWYPLLDRMLGTKIVILGNHDPYKKVKQLLNHVDHVSGPLKYKGYILSHIPIHPSEFEYRNQAFKANIHAHTHGNRVNLNDHRYICVSAEAIDYMPVEFTEIDMNFNRKIKEI